MSLIHDLAEISQILCFFLALISLTISCLIKKDVKKIDIRTQNITAIHTTGEINIHNNYWPGNRGILPKSTTTTPNI